MAWCCRGSALLTDLYSQAANRVVAMNEEGLPAVLEKLTIPLSGNDHTPWGTLIVDWALADLQLLETHSAVQHTLVSYTTSDPVFPSRSIDDVSVDDPFVYQSLPGNHLNRQSLQMHSQSLQSSYRLLSDTRNPKLSKLSSSETDPLLKDSSIELQALGHRRGYQVKRLHKMWLEPEGCGFTRDPPGEMLLEGTEHLLRWRWDERGLADQKRQRIAKELESGTLAGVRGGVPQLAQEAKGSTQESRLRGTRKVTVMDDKADPTAGRPAQEAYLYLCSFPGGQVLSQLHHGRLIDPRLKLYTWTVQMPECPKEAAVQDMNTKSRLDLIQRSFGYNSGAKQSCRLCCFVLTNEMFRRPIGSRLPLNPVEMGSQRTIVSNAFFVLRGLLLSELEFVYGSFCHGTHAHMAPVSKAALLRYGITVTLPKVVRVCVNIRRRLPFESELTQ
eukprot:Gregarina_sp_Poly_1__714@NODE_116_length_13672_cov_23_062992_g103_i0_p4_GENE_NODE_116_length_13672_cov_23_062992_g103_i0NODE_116_length_13672_cov_23_062992_g103_i0_p4_ORF_typecomplete_len444_score71_97_NODE_116_length_13672_cov_23_062992_g103_i037485079